jgi:hypothetical protein
MTEMMAIGTSKSSLDQARNAVERRFARRVQNIEALDGPEPRGLAQIVGGDCLHFRRMLLEHTNHLSSAPLPRCSHRPYGKPNIINWLLAVATTGRLIHDD